MNPKLNIIFSVAYFEEQRREVTILFNNYCNNYPTASKLADIIWNNIIIVHSEH